MDKENLDGSSRLFGNKFRELVSVIRAMLDENRPHGETVLKIRGYITGAELGENLSGYAGGSATRPEWFKFIRVRQRTILGSNLPSDFVISFGPQNICTPAKTEAQAERLAEKVKDWLWMWMTKK